MTTGVIHPINLKVNETIFNSLNFMDCTEKSLSATTDLMLWARFKTGSTEAFSSIYCTYRDDLFNSGCRLTPDRDLVKDSIQDLFLELWVRRANLGDTLSIKYYLLKCLRRRIVKAILRSDSRGANRDERMDSLEQAAFQDENISRASVHLHRTLSKLTKRQREAIYLRFYSNLDTKNIASAMCVSAKGAANLISKGIVAMRYSLKVA